MKRFSPKILLGTQNKLCSFNAKNKIYLGSPIVCKLGLKTYKKSKKSPPWFSCVVSMSLLAKEKILGMESLLYNADSEGSTLLHLAVDSGILPVMKKKAENKVQFRKANDDGCFVWNVLCVYCSVL